MSAVPGLISMPAFRQQTGGGGLSAADNGLSIDPVSGSVVLGNDVGGNLAALLSDREIPMGNFAFRFLDAAGGNRLFELDPVNQRYRMGDIDNLLARCFLFVEDAAGSQSVGMTAGNLGLSTAWAIDDVIPSIGGTLRGNRALAFLGFNSTYLIGDLDNALNGTKLTLDDANQRAIIEDAGMTPYLFIDILNNVSQLQASQLAVTTAAVDLDASVVPGEARILIDGFIKANFGLNTQRVGDISAAANGLIAGLDDATGIFDLSNTALTALFSANGVPGITGTFDVSVTPNITVNGGIITAIT